MTITLEDISKAAGVSISTVSRALYHPDYTMSDETRERITALAKEMNYRPLRPLPISAVRLEGGFWEVRQQVNRTATIPAIHRKLSELGYLDAVAGKWKPGMPYEPHIFWDSDVAKWLEAVSYALMSTDDREALQVLIQPVIDNLAALQQPDGYLNLHHILVEPEKRFRNLRDNHELYGAGHLIEAAVAHAQITGEHKFLSMGQRYADLIAAVFGTSEDQKPGYPGHPELELALLKLFRATGDERYLQLSRYFVDQRGQAPNYFDVEAVERGENPADKWFESYEYNQSHKPVREQTDAVGHSVRALYLYTAMTDLGMEIGDEHLINAVRHLYSSAVERQMYVTGTVGSQPRIEGFSFNYDLPNDTAYAETCAAIALILWMHKMLHLECDGMYADVIERALYNGMLSGISLDGTLFYQVNPLSVDRNKQHNHRVPWIECACCPTNIVRLIASVGHYIYSSTETDAIVHLYANGRAEFHLNGSSVILRQETRYPWSGDNRLTVEIEKPMRFGLRLRVPGWCRHYRLSINGALSNALIERGYLRVEREWQAGDQVLLELDMPIERVYTRPEVVANRGRVALQRGPIVYCLEGMDNGGLLDTIVVPRHASFSAQFEPDLLGGVVTLAGMAQRERLEAAETLYPRTPPRYESVAIKAVPYFAWDNRASGDMLVWIREPASEA